MDLILNELSCQEWTDDVVARTKMEKFLLTCRKAIQYGASRNLRTDKHFCDLRLAPNYIVSQWMNDRRVDKELQRFLKTLIVKTPYIDYIHEKDPYNLYLISQFLFNGSTVKGLGVAYLLNGLAVSFFDNQYWNNSYISLIMKYLEINDSGEDEILTDEVSVPHACSNIHLEELKDLFDERKKIQFYTGLQLWGIRDKIFPNLTFCLNVKDQISPFNLSNPLFNQIIKRLNELNYYFSSRIPGTFEPEKIPCKTTPDSQETLKSYSTERTFKCPDGVEREFSWHVRITPGAWRLYFEPEEKTNKAIIGYIGKKLRTVSDRKVN